MSLSPPAAREPIHHRRIDCRGYRRADGLWDIEGHLTDTKSYAFANSFRGEIGPGEPIHDMWLRLTLDDELTVIKAEAATVAGPFAVCPAITPAFAKLEGLTVGPGWRRAVQARLGGVQECSHLVELLGPLATTAYQTIHVWRARYQPLVETDGPPSHLNSCHALARDGEVVRQHYLAGISSRCRSRTPDDQRGADASSGVRAVMASAWMSVCRRSPSAAYTIRCRSSRLLPAKLADTIATRKWLSPCGRAPAWPVWRADSSTRSSSLGASAAVRRCRIASATGVGRACIGHRTA